MSLYNRNAGLKKKCLKGGLLEYLTQLEKVEGLRNSFNIYTKVLCASRAFLMLDPAVAAR